MTGIADGLQHETYPRSRIALCGAFTSVVDFERPMPPCGWCGIASRAGHYSTGGQVSITLFNKQLGRRGCALPTDVGVNTEGSLKRPRGCPRKRLAEHLP